MWSYPNPLGLPGFDCILKSHLKYKFFLHPLPSAECDSFSTKGSCLSVKSFLNLGNLHKGETHFSSLLALD